MKEIWKNAIYIRKDGSIIDFEGWYEVSNLGRVRSYREHGGSRKINARRITPVLLSPSTYKDTGYLRIYLKIDGKSKAYLLHRLVLSTFMEIPLELKDEKHIDVNHIDENKENNCLSNLEWCSRHKNNTHGTRTKRAIENGLKTKRTEEWKRLHSGGNVHNARSIVGVHVKTGEVIAFESMTGVVDFFKIKLADRSVSATIRGRQKTAYGYYWYYKEVYDKING